MHATSSWDWEPAQPTGSVQCCGVIGSHVCHYCTIASAVDCPCENAVYSIPLTENGREGSLVTLVVFGDFFFFSVFLQVLLLQVYLHMWRQTQTS